MNKIEITNQGRGLILTVVVVQYVCWDLLKDYVLKLMVSVCVCSAGIY